MANSSFWTPKERTRLIINTAISSNVEKMINSLQLDTRRNVSTSREGDTTSMANGKPGRFHAAESENASHWNSPLDFYISILNFSLGYGTILGFPSLCYKHGGGIFVVPYLVMLFLEGIPLVYLEIVIGQRFQDKYIIRMWERVHASTVGLGMSAIFVSFGTTVYFNIMVAWCLRYFIASFQNPLPWSSCPEGFSSCLNSTRPSKYYWYEKTLRVSSDINSFSDINWDLFLYVFIAWFLVWIYNMKGVKVAAKVGYFLLIVGVILYVTLFMLVVHLDDWARGLAIFLNPKSDELKKLLTIDIWRDAATQVFFSLGIGFGAISMYASYNKVNFNCRKAALCYGLIDTTVALCSCIIVFSFYGFQAHTEEMKCEERLAQLNISLENNTSCQSYLQEPLPGGISLAFITWSDSFIHIRYPNLWASISYFVLLTAGLGSMSGMVLPIALFIRQFYKMRQELATGIVCLVSCIIGLVFVTDSGLYMVNIFNSYTGCPLQWVALIEVISIFCVFGRKNFWKMVKEMTGVLPNCLWRICLFCISPAILVTLVILHLYDLSQINIGYKYSTWQNVKGVEVVYYPSWCYVIMGILCLVPLLLIFSMFIFYAVKHRRLFFQHCWNFWKWLRYAFRRQEEFELQEFSEFQHRYAQGQQTSLDRIDANFPELLSFNNIICTPLEERHDHNITRSESI